MGKQFGAGWETFGAFGAVELKQIGVSGGEVNKERFSEFGWNKKIKNGLY